MGKTNSTKEQKNRKRIESSITIKNPNASGIDLGAESHYVAVPKDRSDPSVKMFGCFTSDLHKMADWLDECGIETVAMESTGIYWIPVFQVLELRGFEVILVNAGYVKGVPGRKTDVVDCQWIQELHSYGLLRGSFRPGNDICVLRSFVRQRENVIKSMTPHIQRMQKALTEMNLQLHRVITDITGVTGCRIIEAIIEGERDPIKLAKLKHPSIKNSCDTIAEALNGDWRQEHIFTVRQEYEIYMFYRQKLIECEHQIEQCLSTFECKVDVKKNPLPKPRRRKPVGNQPHFDLRTHLYRIIGVDLTLVNGFDVLTVQTLVSECGLDLDQWPTEGHFTSWLGLCPNHKITGGKVKSRSTRKVNNRASIALRMAAQSLSHSQSALGSFYRRIRSRKGPMKANTAAARKLACLYYRMVKFGINFVDAGVQYYEEKYKSDLIRRLEKSAQYLGYEIVKKQPVTVCVS